MSVSIRLVSPNEGPVIQSILQSQQVELAGLCDWHLPLGPYWLVAVSDRPIGCIMVNPGQPVGRMEWLTVRPDVSKREYATTIRDLCYAGMTMLKHQGSQYVAGTVAHIYPEWKRVIERRNLVPTEEGTLYLGRL